MGVIFKAVSFIGGWVALGVLALGVSAGLYLACDLAEEYSSVVKRYLKNSIFGITVIYFLLIVDGLPLSRCVLGMATHLFYLSLLPSFPYVDPISLPTIGSFLVTVANHIYWFKYFISDDYRYEIHSEGITNAGMKVLGFLFIFVWVVPIGFFVSLQSIEDSLPFAGDGMGGMGSSSYNMQGQPHGQRKKGIFKGMVDSILEKKDAMFPAMAKRKY
mmetsp:Transcript_23168/g.28442  ORF Transcript_23168/g.28442 Transcript_23168/m.28442 type:complete len:216 (+) Transcript_23168:139-786(+)